jgi:hypothetical protein
VFFVPLVFLRKNLFKLMCLFVSDPLIHERGLVSDDELLATAVAPKRTHFLEVRRPALSLSYRHRSHLLNFSHQTAFRSLALRVLALAAALDAFTAICLRRLALNALARALPPRLPISANSLLISSSPMLRHNTP